VVLASSSEDRSHYLLLSVLVIVAPVVVAGVRIPPLVRFKLCHQVVKQSLDPRRARDHDPSNGPICVGRKMRRESLTVTLLIVDQDREMSGVICAPEAWPKRWEDTE
jgi:hypothetical protein